MDTSAVYSDTGTNAIPDYITGTTTGGAQPIGTPYDTPLTLAGVLDEINGSATPLVYVPAIARGTPDFAQYPQRMGGILRLRGQTETGVARINGVQHPDQLKPCHVAFVNFI